MDNDPIIKPGEDVKHALLRHATDMDVDPFRFAKWELADWERWSDLQGKLVAAMGEKTDAAREIAEAHTRYVPRAETLGAAELLALADGDPSVTRSMRRWREAALVVHALESQMIFEGLKIESARTVHINADGEPLLERSARSQQGDPQL